MKLREVVSDTPKQAYIRDYEDKPLEAGQVRATVEYAAAKHGTEFTHFRGQDPFLENRFDEEWQMFIPDQNAKDAPYFMRPGNMWVGTVAQVAPGVESWKPGDKVAWYGPFRSTHTFKENEGLRMAPRMTWKEAMCFDPAQFALGGVRDGQVRLGDNVVVYGLGAIGLIAAQLAKLAGARQVIVCDPIARRRQAALENGADVAIDSAAEDAGRRVKELTNKRGADVTIETSGNYHALQAAIRGAAYNANIAVVGWYHECHGGLDLGREAHFNQPNILISRACSEPNREYPRWNFDRICDSCWEMLGSGLLKCENIVDPVVPFEESAAAYMRIEQNPNESVKLGVDYSL